MSRLSLNILVLVFWTLLSCQGDWEPHGIHRQDFAPSCGIIFAWLFCLWEHAMSSLYGCFHLMPVKDRPKFLTFSSLTWWDGIHLSFTCHETILWFGGPDIIRVTWAPSSPIPSRRSWVPSFWWAYLHAKCESSEHEFSSQAWFTIIELKLMAYSEFLFPRGISSCLRLTPVHFHG